MAQKSEQQEMKPCLACHFGPCRCDESVARAPIHDQESIPDQERAKRLDAIKEWYVRATKHPGEPIRDGIDADAIVDDVGFLLENLKRERAEAEKWKKYHDQLAAAWGDESHTLRHIAGRVGEDTGPRRIVSDLKRERDEARGKIEALENRLAGFTPSAEAEAFAGDLLDEWMTQTHELLEMAAEAFARTVRNGEVPANQSDPDGGLDKMREAYNALHDSPVAVACRRAARRAGSAVCGWCDQPAPNGHFCSEECRKKFWSDEGNAHGDR